MTSAVVPQPVNDDGLGDSWGKRKGVTFSSFKELGLSEEVMSAVRELGISVPTEIQGLGIPSVLEGKSVILGSHTGSGKTLAYMLPIVQVLPYDQLMQDLDVANVRQLEDFLIECMYAEKSNNFISPRDIKLSPSSHQDNPPLASKDHHTDYRRRVSAID
ncbi:hypothetical protein QQ045_031649 [Rhodiola kirilowii]